jgi:hypothetical protein
MKESKEFNHIIWQKYRNLLKISLIIFCGVLFLYLLTVPNVNPDYADSDELITAAYVFGIPHPPGYPLYVLISGLFGRLPIPLLSFAGKINALSAIFHSATVALTFISIFLLSQKFAEKSNKKSSQALILFASIISALSLAFAFHFWFHAVVAEVFSLNSFLVALTMFLLVVWGDLQEKGIKKTDRFLFLASFIYGLAVSNQQASLVMLPVFLYWPLTYVKQPKKFFSQFGQGLTEAISKNSKFAKVLGITLVLFFSGIVIPYVYVPVAASNKPFLNWENAVNLNGIYRLITRRAYADVSPINSAYISFNQLNLENSINQFWHYLGYLRENFTALIFAIGVVGLLSLVKIKERNILGLILLGIICGGLFFALYAPIDWSRSGADSFATEVMIHQRFYLMSLLFYSILISFGVITLCQYLYKINKRLEYFMIGGVVMLMVLMGINHFNAIKKNNFEFGHQYYLTLYSHLDLHAILICFTPEKGCFAGYFLQQVEKLRPDVVIVPADYSQRSIDQLKKQIPDILHTTSTNQSAITRDIVRWQISKRPIYFVGLSPDPHWLSIFNIDGNPYYLQPKGCGLFQVSKSFVNPNYDNPCQSVEQAAFRMPESSKNKYRAMLVPYLAYNHYFAGLVYQKNACVNLAINEYNQAIKLFPDYKYANQKMASLSKLIVPKNDCLPQKGSLTVEEIMNQSEQSKSRKDFENAIYLNYQATVLDPKRIDIRLKLGELYKLANYQSLAKVEYQDILAIDPGNKVAIDQLSRLWDISLP